MVSLVAMLSATTSVAAPRSLSLNPRVVRAPSGAATQIGPVIGPSGLHAAPVQDAERLFAEGEAAYEGGDFALAAERFERAQAIAPHPATLYNLGMAQHRAGEPLVAYATFDRLRVVANTPDERAEAIAAQRRVRRELSAVVVVVAERATVCLDQEALPAREGQRRERLTLPGDHTLWAYGRQAPVVLEPGETHTLWLDTWAERRAAEPTPGRAATGLLVATAVAGGAALGTGVGAVLVPSRSVSRGLAAAAGVSGAVALGTAIATAVVWKRRVAKAAAPAPVAAPCKPAR